MTEDSSHTDAYAGSLVKLTAYCRTYGLSSGKNGWTSKQRSDLNFLVNDSAREHVSSFDKKPNSSLEVSTRRKAKSLFKPESSFEVSIRRKASQLCVLSVLNEHVPGVVVSFLNSAPGNYTIFLGVSPNNVVIGFWLLQRQKDAVGQMLTENLLLDVEPFVEPDTWSVTFDRVLPDTQDKAPTEKHRLYVIKLVVKGTPENCSE